MRLLSPRLKCLQKPARCTQIRHISSRYSNPGKRTFAAAPAQAPSFVGEAQEYASAPELDAGLRPPMSARDAYLLEEERKQYHLRRMRFAGMGLLMTMMGLAFTLYNLDLDQMNESEKKRKGQQLDAGDEPNKQFQGKQVEIIGAGDGKRIVAKGQGEEIELVETGTSSVPHFPRTIYLPTSPESAPKTDASGAIDVSQPNAGVNAGNIENQEQYTLVGLGIRTVSFLSIQVYVVGMYIRTKDITTLQEKLIRNINESASTLIPSEKDELRKRLTDPAASREIWTELLKTPGLKTAWRVSPTRNTDFGHLRDGWITGITNRTREFKQIANGQPTEYEAEDFGKAVGDFKQIFVGGKAPKGSNLILSRNVDGALDVWFQEKPNSTGKEKNMQHLGRVQDERISKLIWLGYLGGDKVSSEAARKGVAEGCVEFAGRPIGSVEAMVT
ncbi:Altered inheritance of mitochondria protein 18, mitochondrial [Pseudocercospora fuligena]|uniref:Altered inheritance of mitochondria protein 18, mitochondrial n=1 Tax=Pseudocercospora fuligena TaxID=685502 RepID=A0A8H6R7D0_9PEZI|nr:Altered inheritance of mitochondria protein 18, mitochondrial [Pseudocercospora fuligena]